MVCEEPFWTPGKNRALPCASLRWLAGAFRGASLTMKIHMSRPTERWSKEMIAVIGFIVLFLFSAFAGLPDQAGDLLHPEGFSRDGSGLVPHPRAESLAQLSKCTDA